MTDPRHSDRTADTSHTRRIRSFVLRQGRITPAQEQAFAAHWTRFGVESGTGLLELDTLFARAAPVVLEIGFGNGAQLLHAASQETQRNFIGIEVHRPGVGRLMNGLAEAGLENVRLFQHDAVEVLKQQIPEGSLDEVRIYFPDPWPKKRHHKRRLIQAEFIELLATRVRSGGLLHLATDWADYAEHMLATMDASPLWRNRAGNGAYSAPPAWRISTHFEKRGVRLGHGVWDLIHERT
ncbi:MAG: tRNA (guanosine(46)-N7)-methyltransferase TrmB [Dokdonella sp.]|jgi:tRNA (guanine-N7-)-methyltransferase|uniref:tRNA (guanosine(46)-N7)-methyltransferase TrmB n=1 Tax=Dokdonella sp. TaxID=2291710 RepID=UPI001B42A9A7|nr:tRNA (guanosine(46)-N7)-methyltransferase TrmB [Dokdonella sp.]MBK8122977.1 tRNA (guanosine(46)-N7)-methyltransferase TrmB [Dokdonella sp.]MBP6326326.1 tRNA (guanosine(46)-N7)-methyltransferase TrmB [Dokdonella sp.]MBP6329092.1 tRNA (guanosine(46)-N7)-methyltransferase TrmB [Dokdonella sp.]HNV07731.1 tRNA (guanosine(46)-N7)-methyltransferase TrmB [Dokdonella sp.]HPW04428.1 tRNA (guanosine(46)-N7)-methyltransferase TrmB [Dokdonella sp.]